LWNFTEAGIRTDGKTIIAGMLQSYVLVWQEESLIQLLKSL